MFTTKPKTITFTANYEGDPNNPDDASLFEDVQMAAIKDFNHTTGDPNYTNAQVLRSSPNSQIGSAIAIPVGQGDKITAVAFAKYIAAAQDPNVSSVTIASALVSAFTGVASSGIEGGTGTINNNFGSGSLIGGTGFPLESGTAPKAFLNLMFLPEDDPINLVKDASFAYDQIADGATEAVIDGVSNSPFDELRIDNFVAPDQGYVMVYVSNEGSLTDVYFDDIEITVEEHPVIEKTDYYPYGMQMAGGYQRITAKENRFKYNGFELQTDLNWGVYDYLARYYDPQIGRFMQVDPAADLMRRHSPYNYAFDNPIRFIDPDGMMPSDKTTDPEPKKEPNILEQMVYAFFMLMNEGGAALNEAEGKENTSFDENIQRSTEFITEVTLEVQGARMFTTSAFGSKSNKSTSTASKVVNAVDDKVDDASKGVNLELNYKADWTPAQKSAADEKAKVLTEAETIVNHSPSRSSNTRGRFKKSGGTVSSSQDVDHKVDLQLGGADNLSNLAPLDKSVNRSLGAQISNRIRHLQDNTRVNNVIIRDPKFLKK